ncbi:MAG: protein translocase subunit SecF [Desulfobacterales bacterium]|nr:protein translocase subunit SecF [Desulfobacterales bacterium]
MQFIKSDIDIDFVGRRNIAFIISGLLIIISILSLIIHQGPRFGIDFAGGTLIQIKFDSPTDMNRIKTGLATIDLGESTVQRFGSLKDNEFLIRTNKSVSTTKEFAAALEKAVTSSGSKGAEIQRIEMVGPQVGQDLREKALFAIFYTLLFITVYISGRFELKWILSAVMAGALMSAVYLLSFFNVSIAFLISAAMLITLFLFWVLSLKYAMGAIVALIHDVIITVGIFSIFDKEFTLPIVAALLTIIGYSLNDTIIVFDRIRENLRIHRNKKPHDFVINRSINETLSRTILTSGTTLIVVVSLFVLGGGIIHDFAFALMVGMVVGVYSSIYVASPILIAFQGMGKKR